MRVWVRVWLGDDRCRSAMIAAQHARQRTQPGACRYEHGPPHRIAEREECEIGKPGAEGAGLLSGPAAEPEVENAESAALWVASASTASSHSTPVTSRPSCTRQLA